MFPNHQDLEAEYIKFMKRKLYYWEFPSDINPRVWGGSGNPYRHYAYLINGTYLSKSYIISSWSKHQPEVYDDNYNKSLLDFLDDISPGLFVGLIKPENLIIEEEMFHNFIRIKE